MSVYSARKGNQLFVFLLLCSMTCNVEGFVSHATVVSRRSTEIISRTSLQAVYFDQPLFEEKSACSQSLDFVATPTKSARNWNSSSTEIVKPVLESNWNLLSNQFAPVSPVQSYSRIRWILGLLLLQTYGAQILKIMVLLLKHSTAMYMTNLAAFPCITKSLTSGIIGFCGDYMAQSLEHSLKKKCGDGAHSCGDTTRRRTLSIHGTYDLRRGLAIMADGFFISGPLMHFGYDLFEHVLPIDGASSRSLAALSHVIADSLILDTAFVATSFLVTGIMEGYRFRQHIIPQFKKDYVNTLKASWVTSAALLPLEFVCFRFLPVTLRTLAVNLTDVVWNAIVSFMTHRNRSKKDLIAMGPSSLSTAIPAGDTPILIN